MQMYTILYSLLLLAMCSAARCAAPHVTATYQPLSSGFLVRFWLHNSTSNDHLYGLGVYTVDADMLSGPPDWHATQTYRQVGWTAMLLSAHVQPGETLGGFSYVSQGEPASLDWWTGGNDGYTGSVTPTAVPEPTSVLALGSGLLALGGLVRRRRR